MSVLPDLGLVAKHILSRTKDAEGNYLKTFTSETNPPDDIVTGLIDAAYDEDWSDLLGVTLGVEMPDSVQDIVREAIAVQAAVLVELSIFRDQIAVNPDAYKALTDERDRLVGKAVKAVMDWRSGDTPGGQVQLGASFSGMESFNRCALPGDGYFVDPGDGVPRWVTLIWDWPSAAQYGGRC